MFQWVGKRLAHFLMKPIEDFMPVTTSRAGALAAALRPADILLVEGNTRIATAIKYLTQSTWSHSALYVGPIAGRHSHDGEPHVLVEADVERGVISSPLSKYASMHVRICRPVGLSFDEITKVTNFTVEQIGHEYDLRNFFDLVRYLLPTPPVPSRFRRRMIALGSGQPTRAICSTLIAQAFQQINYPILPNISADRRAINPPASEDQREEILHIRNFALYTPRDFDVSPYFLIVKPTLEEGFDFRKLSWMDNACVLPKN
jgi:hypothetical protein